METYLAIDPRQNSGNVVDVRRIWLPRVEVEVLRTHKFKIRNRYDVIMVEEGLRFSTGRLEKKKAIH
jgi:hypothetical protein